METALEKIKKTALKRMSSLQERIDHVKPQAEMAVGARRRTLSLFEGMLLGRKHAFEEVTRLVDELIYEEEDDSEYVVHWFEYDAEMTCRVESRADAIAIASAHEDAYIERRTYFYK